MQRAEEPTVEEILESIKKVIARDNRAEAAEERRRRENSGISDELTRDDEDILDLAESAELVDEEEAVEASNTSLVNETAQASMRESLAALSMLSEPGAPPQIVRSGETSLEDMVRELLRPALADWLDKNLPPLVERMVAAEIRRIAGKKT
ncbi:MAG: DUF2497 domain-containing protein [Novosphingobium sp.]|nr:DUF2497 domain-containing protein [Novosphingobium sp.]